MDYKDVLSIDKFNLDVEWERQPGLYQNAAEEAAEAFQKLTSLKDYLTVTSAQIELAYRKGEIDPEAKITEGTIKALIDSNEELAGIKKEIRDQKRVYDEASALVMAFDHKKKALENEVTLYAVGYNASPKEKTYGSTKDRGEYSRDKQRDQLNNKAEKRRRRRSEEDDD